MANNPFGGVPQQNMSAPTGNIQSGQFSAPHPFNAGAGSMQRNWGPTSGPPQQDSWVAQGINAWMMNPANRNNYYNYRATGRGRRMGGRGFWGRNKAQTQQQQQQQPQNPTTQYNFNLNQNPSFGDQTNLGRQDFGSMNTTNPAQQPRMGGQSLPPPTTTGQPNPAMRPPSTSTTATNTSSNTNVAPQIYAPRNNFGGSAQSTAGGAGRPFITLPGITGGTAQSGRSTSAQGADFDRLNIY